MSFDFASYLEALFPGCVYSVERLTGGLVNVTVRARKADTSLAVHGQYDPEPPETLVLKYAPPYIAAVGEAAPFSQDRQTVEATVLGLFDRGGPLSHLNNSSTHIPRVLHHDPVNFVLAMEDLGPLVTLWDFLSPTSFRQDKDSTLPMNALPASPTDTLSPMPSPNPLSSPFLNRYLALCETMASHLATFFAALHSPSTLAAITTHHPVLHRAMTSSVVFDAAVQPILARLQTYGGLDTPAAGELYRRVVADFERGPLAGETCLCMGDLHPGSVLVSPFDVGTTVAPDFGMGLGSDGETTPGFGSGTIPNPDMETGPNAKSKTTSDTKEGQPKMGIIDWEFATAHPHGRGVTGDIPQFLAAMHVLRLTLPPKSPVRNGTDVFIETMCRVYAEHSGLKTRTHNLAGDDGMIVNKADPVWEIMRSAMILHGREIINQAVERDWGEQSAVSVSVGEVVKTGVWYLERAGDNVQEMLETSNWAAMLGEEGMAMLRLFGLVS